MRKISQEQEGPSKLFWASRRRLGQWTLRWAIVESITGWSNKNVHWPYMLPLTRSGVAASLSRGFIIVGHDPPESLPSSLGGVTMCLSTHCMFGSVLTVAFLPPVNFSLASKPWAQEIIRDQDICTLPHKCLSPQFKKKKQQLWKTKLFTKCQWSKWLEWILTGPYHRSTRLHLYYLWRNISME